MNIDEEMVRIAKINKYVKDTYTKKAKDIVDIEFSSISDKEKEKIVKDILCILSNDETALREMEKGIQPRRITKELQNLFDYYQRQIDGNRRRIEKIEEQIKKEQKKVEIKKGMYIVECQNCREANQLNDLVKDKTVRCHICNDIIQVGCTKKEVVKNINILDDHEIRIQELEIPQNKMFYSSELYHNPHICCHGSYKNKCSHWECHSVECTCSACLACIAMGMLGLIVIIGVVIGFIWVLNTLML